MADLVVTDEARQLAALQYKTFKSSKKALKPPKVTPAPRVVATARLEMRNKINVVCSVGESDWRVVLAAVASTHRVVVLSCDVDLIVAACALGGAGSMLFVRMLSANANTLLLKEYRELVHARVAELAKALGVEKEPDVLDRLVQTVQFCGGTDHTVPIINKHQFARLCTVAPALVCSASASQRTALVAALRSATTLAALVDCAKLLARMLVATPSPASVEHHKLLSAALLESSQKLLLEPPALKKTALLATAWAKAQREHVPATEAQHKQKTTLRTFPLAILASAITAPVSTTTTTTTTTTTVDEATPSGANSSKKKRAAPPPTAAAASTSNAASTASSAMKKRATTSSATTSSATTSSATTSSATTTTTTASSATTSSATMAVDDASPTLSPPPPPPPPSGAKGKKRSASGSNASPLPVPTPMSPSAVFDVFCLRSPLCFDVGSLVFAQARQRDSHRPIDVETKENGTLSGRRSRIARGAFVSWELR